jgi:hypothetical protein
VKVFQTDRFTPMCINSKPVRGVLDTEMCVSCISVATTRRLKILQVDRNLHFVVANRAKISILGFVEVFLTSLGVQSPFRLYIIHHLK